MARRFHAEDREDAEKGLVLGKCGSRGASERAENNEDRGLVILSVSEGSAVGWSNRTSRSFAAFRMTDASQALRFSAFSACSALSA